MEEIKLKNRYKISVEKAIKGNITGKDVRAIIEFQMHIEDQFLFNYTDRDMGVLTKYMMSFN